MSRSTSFTTGRLGAKVILAAALALTMSFAAQARPTAPRRQLTPDIHDIFQRGRLVGIIYVPRREEGAVHYVEHWVLFDTYVYPGKDPHLQTTIALSRYRNYETAEEFFAKVPWGPGYRYVQVDSTDTDVLPGRRPGEAFEGALELRQ
jgi:hypothetical protein